MGFIALAEPTSANSGHWVSAWLQEEPLSLCAEQEGDREFPYLFCAALTHPFRSEGGVEYARLPSVGASSDTSGELLSGKSKWRPMPHSIGLAGGLETHSKSTRGLLQWVLGPFDWPRGLGASLRWDPIQRPPCRSRTRLRAAQAIACLGLGHVRARP